MRRMQTRRILLASLVGTTIEFFDFYIYATAAALVFPRLFFPKVIPPGAAAVVRTFGLAFLRAQDRSCSGTSIASAARRPGHGIAIWAFQRCASVC
jgi:hypothetical protein